MTQSAIDPNINTQFPVLHGNDSQVFRNNFNTIKASLTSAKLELSDLLSNTIRVDSQAADFNNIAFKNQVSNTNTIYRHDITGIQLQSFDIDYRNGLYQTVQVGANVTINLKNFPLDASTTNIGRLRLHISADRTSREVTLTNTTAFIKYDPDFPFTNTNKLTIPGSGGKDPVIIDIWQVNENDRVSTPTMYIKYVGSYFYHAAAPTAPVSYVDNKGLITSQNSTANTTDDTTPGIKVTSAPNYTPVLYVNGVYTESIFHPINLTLTPTVMLSDGTYHFTYTMADAQGNESSQSLPISITIDSTAPITGAFSLPNDTGSSSIDGITNSNQITVSNLEAGATWQYSVNGGTTWVNGIGTTFTLSDGTYGIGSIKMRQIDAVGNIQSTNIPTNTSIITVDTNPPTSGTLSLAVDDGASSSDGNSTSGVITVSGLESGATWEYSIDSGNTWASGSGTSFTLSDGTYGIGQLKVRQTDLAGNIQTIMAVNTIAYTIDSYVPPPPPPPIPGGIPASNAAWGGAGYGGTANYKGGYSAAGGHNGNGGGGSASPLGGDGGNWLSANGSDGTYGTGGSGGGYEIAGVAGTGLLPGFDAINIMATGIGNGGGGIETDSVNSGLSNARAGNGTGGLIRITIHTGSYSFTPADLTAFSGTRLAAANSAIEWDNSSAIKTSSDPYDHALIGQFTVPTGVTKINIGVIGGGGGGAIGPCVNAGGGGGGAALYTGYTVVPGTVYTIKVGAGGQGGFQGSSRGGAGGPPYNVTEVPWRGGKSAFCTSTGTELIYATGGNTRPDNCAALTNADSATADTADVPGTNVVGS